MTRTAVHYLYILIAIGTIVGAISYPIAVYLLAIPVDGYSHTVNMISELGVAGIEHSWLLTLILLIEGALALGLAYSVQKCLIERDKIDLSVILIALFGLSLIIGGAFPCDESCRPTSLNGWIHVLNSIPSLVATLFAPFVIARRFRENEAVSNLSTLTFIIGTLLIVSLLFAAVLFPMFNFNGLGQRIVLAFQLSFFVIVAYAVVHLSLRPQHMQSINDPAST